MHLLDWKRSSALLFALVLAATLIGLAPAAIACDGSEANHVVISAGNPGAWVSHDGDVAIATTSSRPSASQPRPEGRSSSNVAMVSTLPSPRRGWRSRVPRMTVGSRCPAT